ncbi:porin family protein [Sphingomonas sp. CARO-RG-8B-R24-01]|uniref:outer membrane protein n=1 Tax=Sphingomonas sp. CARO-RG-8B-R24-01 TaxID=2914831 RepID=UPI001F58FAB1|nr:porin family protein [Sphingomonas sp. CARO-RG-8B-R24-01]
MRTILLVAAAAAALSAGAASAQDVTTTTTDTTTTASGSNTAFRGFRLEGNAGGDRFQSQGRHHDKFGYGATIGFDGVIADRIVVGPEATFWKADSGNENCGGAIGGSVCHKSFEEFGVGVRAGYLLTPQALVFAKGGYVTNEQRKRFDATTGTGSYYDHFNTTGYQVGGGVEYTVTQGRLPVYVDAQYVYSQYNDHTSRQRVMGGIGVRFK